MTAISDTRSRLRPGEGTMPRRDLNRPANAAEALERRRAALADPTRPKGHRGETAPVTPEATCDLLGLRLREAREAAGLSRAEAYRRGGPSPQEAWAYESGTRSVSLGMLCVIAELYKKPTWWFLYEVPVAEEGAERYPMRDRWRGAGGERRREP